jgi:hypothetical protein
MEQDKTDRILEVLLARMEADKAESMARREADKAESKAERKADKEMMARMEAKMESSHERMMAKMDAWLGKTGACRESTEACPEVTPACLEEEKAPTPEETKAVAEKPQEVPKGAKGEEAIRAAKDRSRDLRLAVRCRRRLKTQTKRDGRLRQECAAVRWPTHRFVPALRKGGLRKRLGKECRSGIRRPGRTFHSRINGRSLKQRQIKGNVAQETPEGRTYKKRRRTLPECNSGIRNRGARQHLLLKKGRILSEVIRQSLRLEITGLIVGSFNGLREPRNGTLWKRRHPPKWKR